MRSAWLVAGDFIRDTFEVDSRLFRTLKLMFRKPGQLSIEFSRNRRAHYMSPVRLFLFVSFLHFGLMALVTPRGPVSDNGGSSGSSLGYGFPMDLTGADSLFKEPTQAQIESARAGLGPEQRDQLDDILGRGPDDVNRMIVAGFLATETRQSGGMRSLLFRLMIEVYHDPERAVERTLRWGSVILVVSLPAYALLLSVVYFDKRRLFVEHLVLVVHLNCFSLLALLIPIVAPSGFLLRSLLWIGIALGTIVYYTSTLRRYFQEGWATTFVRWFAFAVLSMCFSMGTGLILLFLT